ncbi:hypothetical protein ON010_g2837 [Phytophthora cinnamomi]|nr:hypothetical protein ON010_g2837 [Phytophthora cinnamomi]
MFPAEARDEVDKMFDQCYTDRSPFTTSLGSRDICARDEQARSTPGTMSSVRRPSSMPPEINTKDPKVRAELYMASHGIKELFEGLGTLLLYHRPSNPREFLTQQLGEMRKAKQEQSHIPFFEEHDLKAMFAAFDIKEQGFITPVQYDRGANGVQSMLMSFTHLCVEILWLNKLTTVDAGPKHVEVLGQLRNQICCHVSGETRSVLLPLCHFRERKSDNKPQGSEPDLLTPQEDRPSAPGGRPAQQRVPPVRRHPEAGATGTLFCLRLAEGPRSFKKALLAIARRESADPMGTSSQTGNISETFCAAVEFARLNFHPWTKHIISVGGAASCWRIDAQGEQRGQAGPCDRTASKQSVERPVKRPQSWFTKLDTSTPCDSLLLSNTSVTRNLCARRYRLQRATSYRCSFFRFCLKKYRRVAAVRDV